MIGSIIDWPLSSGALLWFYTTLVQVSMLAALALLGTRFLQRNAVVKHSILMVALLLIAIAPWSVLCLQKVGLGVIVIAEPFPLASNLSSSLSAVVEASRRDGQEGIEIAEAVRANQHDLLDTERVLAASESETDVRVELQDAYSTIATSEVSNPTITNPAYAITPNAKATESHQDSRYSASALWLKQLFAAFALLWLIGSCVMAVRWMVAWTRLQRMIGRSMPVKSDDVESAYLEACLLCECNPQAVRLVTSPSITTPVVAGMVRPTIILPATLLGTIPAEQIVQIFIHELAHIIRRDQFILTVQQIVRVLFWAHPLVERVSQRLTRASEEICDNHVLAITPTKVYSQTLLVVAELATGRRNPVGTIGVVGGWSLTERIAGLLDKRRERETRLNGRSKASVAMLTMCFSLVLLLTSRIDLSDAEAQGASPSLAQVEPLPVDPRDCIRGTGDQLEFRLHGRLLSSAHQPLVSPSVQVRERGSGAVYPATVSGNRYEVWLTAKKFRWFTLTLEGQSADGRSGVVSIDQSGLRKAISEGVDVLFQQPTRSIKVSVKHNDQPVANAQIKAFVSSSPTEIFSQSDASGEAILKLNAKGKLSEFTAWTDSGLLGGYQFHQGPQRDPHADEHVIELLECQERRIQVVDSDGAPVAGVHLKLHVATPENYNYLGHPTGCEVVTDANGIANYRWFPKLEGAHHYADLVDERDWRLHSQRNTDSAVEVVVKKPAKRVRVDGQVSRGGQYVGGVVVEATSFQGEQKGQADKIIALADEEGNFSFDALPKSTYALFVIDHQWVSEPKVFTAIDPDSGENTSLYLMALDGHPVTVQLTSGPDRKPIAGQSVSLISEHQFTWKVDGETRNGVTHRQIFTTTDRQGLATANVPLGSLRADVYTSSWRSESKIVVAADHENRVELHRAQDTATNVSGQIVLPPFTSIDLKKVSIAIQAIDGQFSEQFTPVVDESGQFSFETKASAVGCFAFSADGQWAAAALVEDLSRPFNIELFPVAYLSGQLLDGEGKPIGDHPVSADPRIVNSSQELKTIGFSSSMKGKSITTKTDANGNYRLGPLPRQIEIGVWCDATKTDEENGREYLGKYFIELDEQRPPQVHRLGPQPNSTSKQSTIEARIADILRDARLGGFHAMIILSDYADDRCRNFVDQNLLDYNTNAQVYGYMQLRLNTGEAASDKGKAFATAKNWPFPTAGSVVVVALDTEGKELGQAKFDVTGEDAELQAVAFVEKHLPSVIDARQKWDEAFALAKKTDRRVWVRISQRYCGPCHLLNRWLDDHREMLEKEFVMLKVDDVRDLYGAEIVGAITGERPYSIPFFAFFDEEQELLINSIAPTGNIGFMSGFEGKRHFRKMLEQGNRRLTDEEIARLLTNLDD